jgi:DnaJ-class molecular chaperone
MKTPEEHIANGWTTQKCDNCDGKGQIPVYTYAGMDFCGPKECRDCNGSGRIWKSPKGKLFSYPGGKFL